MISPSKLLKPAEQPMAVQSNSDEKITEGDNFQNHGGKGQCILASLLKENFLKQLEVNVLMEAIPSRKCSIKSSALIEGSAINEK